MKRLFDIIASLIMLIILSPVFLIVSVIIIADDGLPVIFRQHRVGKGNELFYIYKFRTMRNGTRNVASGSLSESGECITKSGRFLRRTSLDELPQMINIIKGDMSVVGPRPCVTYELGDFETLNRRYKKRFEVKAGLTGLAQVKGRNDIKWDDKVGYDNQYVDEFNRIGVLIDLKILWWSVIKVLEKNDIYESKSDDSMTDVEAAKFEEEEIIRIAHLPD